MPMPFKSVIIPALVKEKKWRNAGPGDEAKQKEIFEH